MLVVCDTGPILHLQEIGAVHLLDQFGPAVIPPQVETELNARIEHWLEIKPNWLQTVSLEPAVLMQALAWFRGGLLHGGEAEAIALGRAAGADLILTDDIAARLFARSLGFEVHGSLGIVLAGAARGRLMRHEASDLLDALSRSTLWISDRILTEARAALDAIFA